MPHPPCIVPLATMERPLTSRIPTDFLDRKNGNANFTDKQTVTQVEDQTNHISRPQLPQKL